MKHSATSRLRSLFGILFTALSLNAALPEPPLDLRPAWVDDFSAVLTWEPRAGESWNVYRYDQLSQAWLSVGSSLAIPMFREAPGQQPPWDYAVTAVNADGESAPAIITVAHGGFPDFMITYYDPRYYPWLNGRTSTTLQFVASPVDGVEAFLEFGASPQNLEFAEHHPDFSGWHTFTITNLSAATEYFYRVTFINTNRLGFSFSQSFYTLPPNVPPEAYPVAVEMFEDQGPNYVFPNAFDPDLMSSPTFRIVTQPAHGSATVEGFYLVYIPETNFFGTDSFTYSMSDEETESAPATVTVTIYPVNDQSIILTESLELTMLEDSGAVSASVEILDIDGNDNWLGVQVPPEVGEVQCSGTNFTYLPHMPNFHGDIHFVLVAYDPIAPAAGSVNVTVHVISVNDAPTIEGFTGPILEDIVQLVELSASDPEGDPLTYTIVDLPQHGTLTGTAPTLYYTAFPEYNGPDHFSVKVSDGQAESAPADYNITVVPVDDMPVAQTQEVVTSEDTPVDIDLQVLDPDGGIVIWKIKTPPQHGTLSGTPPNVSYTPAPEYSGTDSFEFRTEWDEWSGTEAQVTITILAVNDLPVGQNSSITTTEDQLVICAITATDVEGAALTFEVVRPPSNGSLSPFSTAPYSVAYTPAANFFGHDSFDLRANDGASAGNIFTITINVTEVDDAPIAAGQIVSGAEDQPIAITLAATDIDGGPISWSFGTLPTHGVLSGTAPNLIYTPAANYNGNDSFTFQVSNGESSSSASVNIQVTPVNDPPVGQNSSVTTSEDRSVICPIVASDLEGDALTFEVIRPPANGSLSGFSTAPYSIAYTPTANYAGPDSFDVRAYDGASAGNTFTIAVLVSAVDDPPIANAQNIQAIEDQATGIALTASDMDGGPISWTVGAPAHGVLSGTAPDLTYTPAANYNGSDFFTFLVSNGQSTSSATVTIQVASVNDAPVANGQSVTTAYNTPVAITLTGTDIDGQAVTYTLLTSPANGVLGGTAPNLTFTPTIGWSGTTSFTYRVSDGGLSSAAATVTITVQAATSVPVAPSSLTAQAISKTQINLTWSDISNNEDSFKIERSAGTTWSQVATVGPNVRTYSDTGLTSNKTYSYRVRAFNMLGNSSYSNTASARTLK